MGFAKTYSVDEDDVQNRQQVNMPPPENALPGRPAQLAARCPAHIIHSLHSQLDLILPQVKGSAILRQIRDEEEARTGNRQADHAIHDEQPLPPGQAVQAVHAFVDARLQVAAEHRRRG
jgi:hypothetical protein